MFLQEIVKIFKFQKYKDNVSGCQNALHWIKNNIVQNKGIKVTSKKKVAYHEVTGYMIPTLYQWGEKILARDLASWLIRQQNSDGSFSAPDGTPYTFDTGQVIRGFLTTLNDLPQIEIPLRKACDWIINQIQPDARLSTPSTKMWGRIADNRIHLYVLPPLIEAGKILNVPKYILAVQNILGYYKQKKELIEFNTLSHFIGYIVEALCDLGEIHLARTMMENIVKMQKKDGSIPAYQNVRWICVPGVAQFAVALYKLNMNTYADKAMDYLFSIQNKSGGFYGGYGIGARYFSRQEVPWAVKFFLDAYYWKIKNAFNNKVNIFPETIDESDGRVREIISFFSDLSGKKIIDVGCGKGRFLKILRDKSSSCELYGLDISEKMLKFCPPYIKSVRGSMLNIDFADNFFDFVYSVEALEHSVLIDNAIREMCRILKPKGKIIIIDKNIKQIWRLKIESWEQWFSPEDIILLLNKYNVEANYKFIAYGKHSRVDGLFIAWEGIKNA